MEVGEPFPMVKELTILNLLCAVTKTTKDSQGGRG
jgi:hypothetical protein